MKLIKNNFVLNTGLNFIFRLLNMVISYITIPLTLRYLGNERYGVWQTVLTIISWAAISNFGISNGLRNKITESIAVKNNKKLKGYITSAYIYLSIISIIILVTASVLILFINTNTLFKNNTLSRNEVIISFVIVILSFCINFVLGISSSIAYGIHKSALVNFFQVLSSLLILLGLVLLKIVSNPSLINISLIYLVGNSLSNFLFTALLFSRKSFRPNLKLYNSKYGKELTAVGLEFFVLQIANIVLFSTDNFIISMFIGVESVTNYSITAKLFQMVSTLFSICLIQLWSAVAKANFENNFIWIKNAIRKLLMLLIPTILVVIIMLFNFQFIIKIWIGHNFLLNSRLIFLCAIYSLLICFNGIFVNVQNGMNRTRPQIIPTIFCSILNIPLALILIKGLNMGVNGVMLSNIISLAIMTFFSCKDIKYIFKKND